MQQILTLWSSLDLRRQVIVVAATLAVFTAVLMLSRIATLPSMSLLYSGLESSAAGEVVAALDTRNVTYEVRGGSIFVDTQRRDELRMTLASEGLPANGGRGYELLDSMTGFGTTAQMFDAAYWRAKEGELARTIAGNPQIDAARVHIAGTSGNPFQRNLRPTASVSVKTLGATLSPQQARAIRHLVAGAVTGMVAEDIAVIDSAGGLIAGDETTPANGMNDRTTALRERLQRLLEARVGLGNAIVELSIDTVTDSELIRERTVDPASRTMISSDTEQSSGTEKGGGGVTVASNLPDGQAAEGEGSSSQSTLTRERMNYEVSETEREVTRGPGAIRRMTVAVLVNGIPATDAAGTETIQPRPDAELDALRDLVASAVGLDTERGDVITIKSMTFDPGMPAGLAVSAGYLAGFVPDPMTLIQLAVLAIVVLVLGLFVIRPILLAPSRALPPPVVALPPPGMQGSRGIRSDSLPALTGEIAGDDGAWLMPGQDNLVDAGSGRTGESPDPVERLRALITERQQDSVEILRSWLEEREERA